jgi:stress-induced morphogen
MGGKMLVNQRRQFHALHLFEQQRNVIDALGENMLDVIHAQSLAQSSI